MGATDPKEGAGASSAEAGEAARGAEASEMMSAVVDNAVVGMAYLDADGAYLLFNRGAELLTGYGRDEARAGGLPTLFPPDASRKIAETLAARGRIENMEVTIRRKDGSAKDLILSMSSCRAAGSSRSGFVQFFVDNTEKRHLQELLLHSQKMEVVGMMAGGIAHDFNNLLEGILGYTTFMMDLIEENHELRSYLEIIESSAKKASDLTERLLTFSLDRWENTSVVDCNALLGDVVKLLERTIDRRIVIEMNLAKDLRRVRGAAGQLENAFLNVCLNARDAMPDGGKLMVRSENVGIDEGYPRLSWNMKPGEYVRLSIADTGVGMDRETREKIFEPFFTTKKRGEGAGLGLNMVYGIVTNHGGFINVYSEAGHGAVFNIYLPADTRPAPEEGAAERRDGVPAGKNELILFIDDEKVVCDLGRELLEKLSYRALTAGDAEEGLRLFQENMDEVDLVILDYIMPGAGGRSVLERMLELRPDVTVLLSSGYSRSCLGEGIEGGGRVHFIQKPYSMEELAREVRRLIDGKQAPA